MAKITTKVWFHLDGKVSCWVWYLIRQELQYCSFPLDGIPLHQSFPPIKFPDSSLVLTDTPEWREVLIEKVSCLRTQHKLWRGLDPNFFDIGAPLTETLDLLTLSLNSISALYPVFSQFMVMTPPNSIVSVPIKIPENQEKDDSTWNKNSRTIINSFQLNILAQRFSFPFDSTFSGKQFFHLYHLSYQSQ